MRSQTELQQSSRIKTSTCQNSKQVHCDCLILTQQNKQKHANKGLNIYLLQAKYCAIVVC